MINIRGLSDDPVEAVVFDLGGVILDVDFQRSLTAFRELNLRKPDGAICRHAASEIGLPPENVLSIDDNAANIARARIEGWQAHHLTGGQRITNLFEL